MGNLEENEGNGLKGKERVLTPHMEWMNTWHNMTSIAREPENPGLGKTGGPGLFSASGAAHVWSVAQLSDYLFILPSSYYSPTCFIILSACLSDDEFDQLKLTMVE